jgi:hypothetical protein
VTENKAPEAIDENYVEERYKSQIDYYWNKSNKTMHKQFRFWIITLGALVTLISSLSAADFIQSNDGLRILFAIITPIIAAALTILNGLSQNFHWGATWRDMVVSATRLQKERDHIHATRPEDRDFKEELNTLNAIVLEETKNFFRRVLDSEVKPEEASTSSD